MSVFRGTYSLDFWVLIAKFGSVRTG